MDRPTRDESLTLERIEAAMRQAMSDLADETVLEIQESISIPVGYDFAGNVVIRSKPGEPPRKEEGILHFNVEHVGIDDGDDVVERISSHRPPESNGDDPMAAMVLELEINRPYMRPAMTRLRERGLSRIIEYMRMRLRQ